MDEKEKKIRRKYARGRTIQVDSVNIRHAFENIDHLLTIIDGLREENEMLRNRLAAIEKTVESIGDIRDLIAAVKGTHESRSWEGRVMDIEKKLTEIIKDAVWDDLSRHTATKFAKAILASPDIAVVEKAKLEKKEVNTEC